MIFSFSFANLFWPFYHLRSHRHWHFQGWANIFYEGPHWKVYCYRGPHTLHL